MFVVAVVGFNLGATFASPEVGGGNSAATLALATSVTGLILALKGSRDRLASATAALTLVSGTALLLLRDAHGEVVVGGLLVGLLLGRWPVVRRAVAR